MPNQDDIAAQQELLQMHRQTLDVLLKQQAQLGESYAPPAIINGIRIARASIAQIKQSLRDWGGRPDAAIYYAISWAEGRRP